MTITGTEGKLKVGFQDAAMLGTWELTHSAETLNNQWSDVSAKVSRIDEFWYTQRPMVLGLWMRRSWWVWSDTEVEFDGIKTVTIRVKGNPEAKQTF